jgi:hypothetical protein
MHYATWVHNRLSPNGFGASPEEIWIGIKSSGLGLSRAHVFGCPVYVLDPCLQDGQKITKRNRHVSQGIFVGTYQTTHLSSLLCLTQRHNMYLPNIMSFFMTIFILFYCSPTSRVVIRFLNVCSNLMLQRNSLMTVIYPTSNC